MSRETLCLALVAVLGTVVAVVAFGAVALPGAATGALMVVLPLVVNDLLRARRRRSDRPSTKA